MKTTVKLKPTMIAMVCLLLVGAACVVVPMLVMRPFQAQSPDALQLALSVRRWRPWVTCVCAVLALALAWRCRRWQTYAFAVLPVAVAALSFVNVFELMFRPVLNPMFAAAKDAGVEDGDMVLAVNVGGQQRSYPVRMLAYHHIVNDRVGGVAIVGTY